MKKKCVLFCCFILCYTNLNALTFIEIIKKAFENNIDILNAKNEMDISTLDAKYYDGKFMPSVNIISSVSDINSENSLPGTVTAGISVSQIVPGGTVLSTEFDYSLYENLYSNDIVLNPSITFTLSQSLLPFWIQGKIKDPTVLSYELQLKYKEIQLEQMKKNVFQNLLELYIKFLILNDEIKIKENDLNFLKEQIFLIKKLESLGSVSLSRVFEIENKKWEIEQNLFSLCTNKTSMIKEINDLCGIEISENEIELQLMMNDDFLCFIKSQGFANDFIKKLYKLKFDIFETNKIFQRQNNAPIINVSTKIAWLQNISDSNEIGLSIGINFSPLLQFVGANINQKNKLDEKELLNSYENYLKQKEFLIKQYDSILEYYKKQVQSSEKICEELFINFLDARTLYENGAISKIDFNSKELEYNNFILNKDILDKYCYLYEIFLFLQKD